MGNIEKTVEDWMTKWFPESTNQSHPVPYLSAAFHHVREAADELKTLLGVEKPQPQPEPEVPVPASTAPAAWPIQVTEDPTVSN